MNGLYILNSKKIIISCCESLLSHSTCQGYAKHLLWVVTHLGPQKSEDTANAEDFAWWKALKRISRYTSSSGPHDGPPCGTYCLLGQRWMSKLNARVLISRASVSRSRKLPVRLPPVAGSAAIVRSGSVIFSPLGTCPRVYAWARYGKLHVKCGSYTRANINRPRENRWLMKDACLLVHGWIRVPFLSFFFQV